MLENFKGRNQVEFPELLDADVSVHERVIGNRLPIRFSQDPREKPIPAAVVKMSDRMCPILENGNQGSGICPGSGFDVVRIHDDIFVVVYPLLELLQPPSHELRGETEAAFAA